MPKRGFTLIELLVVISLIGILATLMMANFASARGRSRDAQRKSDLRQISTALRLYYNDNGKYPLENLLVWGSEWSSSGGTVYMNMLPKDPQDPDRTYAYTPDTVNDTFTLTACLENVSDDKCDKDGLGGIIPCTDGCQYSIKP